MGWVRVTSSFAVRCNSAASTKIQEEQNMNQDEQKPCCVNCHISGVPLYLGLDGKQHCADHIGLLLPDFPKQETKPVRKDVIL